MSRIAHLASLCNYEFSIHKNPHKHIFNNTQLYLNYLKSSGIVDADEIPLEVQNKILHLDTLIVIHFYPDNPVGRYVCYHYDIDLAIEEMIAAIEEVRM